MSNDSIHFHGTPFTAKISEYPGQLRLNIEGDGGVCYLTYGQVRELRVFLEAAEPRLKKDTQTAKFRELFHELGPETIKAFLADWERNK